MSTPLSGSIQYGKAEQIAKELSGTEFFQDTPQNQTAFLTSYIPTIDSTFEQIPQQDRAEFVQKVVLPDVYRFRTEVKPAHGGLTNQPAFNGPIQPQNPNSFGQIGKDLAASVMNTTAGALKGGSFGYLDATEDARNASAVIGASPELWRDAQIRGGGIHDGNLAGDIARGGGELAGATAAFGGIGKGINAGLGALGRNLLPRTTGLAMAAGVPGVNFARAAMNAASWMRGGTLLPQMAMGGLEGLIYGGARSVPGHQLDMGQRAQHALTDAAMGAVGVPAAHALGGVIKGGVKALGDVFNPEQVQIGLRTPAARQSASEAQKALQYLDQVWTKIKRGEIDPKLVTADDYASLVTTMERTAQAAKTGKPINRAETMHAGARIERKAKIRAKQQNRPIESEQNVQERQVEQQQGAEHAQGRQESQQQAAPLQARAEKQGEALEQIPGTAKTGDLVQDKQITIPLYGTVKAMMEQLAKRAGLVVDDLLHAKPDDLTPDQKDIRAAIKSVKDLEVVDEANAILMQPEVTPSALKYDDIADLVDDTKTGETLRDAAIQGKATRVEYAAEIEGRSDKAAKITATGNVKVEVTTFTPTSFGKTTKIMNPEAIPVNPKTGKPYGKEAKVVKEMIESGEIQTQDFPLVRGYNEAGHPVTYHINKSPEGSQILKAKTSEKAPFVGELPNVYLGPRPFSAKSVLERGVRSITGPVKTSDAISVLEEATNNMDKVFRAIDDPRTPPALKKLLTRLKTKETWDNKDIRDLQFWLNKRDFKTVLCDILGLTHGRL